MFCATGKCLAIVSAKDAQGLNEAKVAELEDKISRAEVIDPAKLSGSTVKFGGDSWTVVGSFDAGGSAFDSEVWCDAEVLGRVYQRPPGFFQSSRFALRSRRPARLRSSTPSRALLSSGRSTGMSVSWACGRST